MNRSLARSMLEARIGTMLDEIEARSPLPYDEEEGDQMVLDVITMMYAVMGRLVGTMPDPILRQRAYKVVEMGFDWSFTLHYRQCLEGQEQYR